jgi:hypothetical protein
MPLIWLVAFFVCVLFGDVISARTSLAAEIPPWCDKRLLGNAGTDHPYAVRKSYCDGNVFTPHKGELELVSLTYGPVTYATHPKAPLLIELPSRTPRISELKLPIYVRGLQKTPEKNYRLDAAFNMDGKLAIDRDAAITPIGIAAADLGIFAWSETPTGAVYVPVVVGSSQGASAGAMKLIIRPPIATPVIKYEIVEATTLTKLKDGVAARNVAAGQPTEISIPAGTEALLTVTVTALIPGELGYTRSVTLIRPAQP